MRYTLCVASFAFGLLLVASVACGGAQAPSDRDREAAPQVDSRDGELLPRALFFADPDRANVRLSPDGQRIAWLAPHHGVLNVFVAPVDDIDAAVPMTSERNRGVRNLSWAWTSEHVLYSLDKGGDENWVIYSLNLRNGLSRALTPEEGVAARVQQLSPEFPEEILVSINERTPQLHDIYRVDITSGDRELVLENPGFIGFTTGEDFEVHFAATMTPDGGIAYLRPSDSETGFEPAFAFPMEDTLSSGVLDVAADGTSYLAIDSRGQDTAALVRLSASGEVLETLYSDPRADVSNLLMHPETRAIDAVAVEYARTEWILLDDALARDWDALASGVEGDFEILSRSLDDERWLVAYLTDDGPVLYYLYERDSRELSFLFTNRSAHEGLALAPMYPVLIEARDGLGLVSYLTLPLETLGSDPPARDMEPMPVPNVDEPVPMVLLVHGGPWARDNWGYNSLHQWLANRGYAVLSVNFRGSTGFGKEFINASTGEWGGAMHDDLIDAVAWAIENGITTPDDVAIMGGSYGGYAALVGLTFTPDAFACGVSIVGPSNLVTLFETIPPYWEPMLDLWATRVGDARTEEGRELLEERSPLNRVDEIRRPLLIGQGANDPRVKVSESDQIAWAMAQRGIPFTYALFPDEGHGFARPENRLAFYAVTEEFLGDCLGGQVEPVGDAFAGSSIRMIGADDLEEPESNDDDDTLHDVDADEPAEALPPADEPPALDVTR